MFSQFPQKYGSFKHFECLRKSLVSLCKLILNLYTYTVKSSVLVPETNNSSPQLIHGMQKQQWFMLDNKVVSTVLHALPPYDCCIVVVSVYYLTRLFVPATKHFALVVTCRKEMQTPPLFTELT